MNIDAIREKWMAVKGKDVEISFPKSVDPGVVKCMIDAARGDVYDLLDHILDLDDQLDGKDRIIYDQKDQIRKLRMKAEGITEQDITETMPPRQGH